MIPVAASVRIWIATGHTDMRKGMQGLALLVQEGLGRDPFAGDVFVFRGRGGSLIKALWHDGIGLSLYAKRLDRGRFVWPVTVDGVVALTAAQMSYLLEAIDWRNPQHTWRPQSAGHSGRGSASRFVASSEQSAPGHRTAERARWRPPRAQRRVPLATFRYRLAGPQYRRS